MVETSTPIRSTSNNLLHQFEKFKSEVNKKIDDKFGRLLDIYSTL